MEGSQPVRNSLQYYMEIYVLPHTQNVHFNLNGITTTPASSLIIA